MGFLRRLFGSPSPEATRVDGPQAVDVPIFDARPRSAVGIVGESHYQATLERLAEGRTDRGPVRVEHVAGLIAEPSNPYDPNAVKVQIGGATVGYLTRSDAVAYKPVLEAVAHMGYAAFGCHASLIGGWDRGGGDRGSIGVVLHLGTPRELLVELGVEVAAPAPAPQPAIEIVLTDPATVGALAGRAVCFTGESGCTIGGAMISRATQEALAVNAGLAVLPRVTKKLDVLVVSTRAETTGKVAKALEYGVPCVDERAFWLTLGVKID
jgi:hypothetical protein